MNLIVQLIVLCSVAATSCSASFMYEKPFRPREVNPLWRIWPDDRNKEGRILGKNPQLVDSSESVWRTVDMLSPVCSKYRDEFPLWKLGSPLPKCGTDYPSFKKLDTERMRRMVGGLEVSAWKWPYVIRQVSKFRYFPQGTESTQEFIEWSKQDMRNRSRIYKVEPEVFYRTDCAGTIVHANAYITSYWCLFDVSISTQAFRAEEFRFIAYRNEPQKCYYQGKMLWPHFKESGELEENNIFVFNDLMAVVKIPAYFPIGYTEEGPGSLNRACLPEGTDEYNIYDVGNEVVVAAYGGKHNEFWTWDGGAMARSDMFEQKFKIRDGSLCNRKIEDCGTHELKFDETKHFCVIMESDMSIFPGQLGAGAFMKIRGSWVVVGVAVLGCDIQFRDKTRTSPMLFAKTSGLDDFLTEKGITVPTSTA